MNVSRLAFLFAALSLMLGSCASVPKVTDESGVDISVERLTEIQAASSFGGSPDKPNPYRTPGGLLMGKPNEFVVCKVKVNAVRDATVFLVKAEAVDLSGTSVATFEDMPSFIDYTNAG